MYLLHRKKNDIYANISIFLSYSGVTVATRSGPYPAQTITAVNRSSPYPDHMVDHHLEMTSTVLNVCGDQDTLHSDFAAVGTNYWFVWPEENWPPDWAWFLPRFFSLFCHRWSFGSLSLSPLACLVGDTLFPVISPTWLHRYYLNWTELDNDITEFNNEMPLTQNLSCFDIVQLLWHNLYCVNLYLQIVKALYK